jgi:hypothetical protein
MGMSHPLDVLDSFLASFRPSPVASLGNSGLNLLAVIHGGFHGNGMSCCGFACSIRQQL